MADGEKILEGDVIGRIGPEGAAPPSGATMPVSGDAANADGAIRDGRDWKSGKFVKGWKGGPGCNRLNRYTHRLRRAIARAATPEKMEKVVRALVEKGEKGDVAAAAVLLDRTLGKAKLPIDQSRAAVVNHAGMQVIVAMKDPVILATLNELAKLIQNRQSTVVPQ